MVTRSTKSGSSARFRQVAGLVSGAWPAHGGLDSGNSSDLQSVTQCLRVAVQTDSNERQTAVDALRFFANLAGRTWDVGGANIVIDRKGANGFNFAVDVKQKEGGVKRVAEAICKRT